MLLYSRMEASKLQGWQWQAMTSDDRAGAFTCTHAHLMQDRQAQPYWNLAA